MNQEKTIVVGIGEALWDVLPGGKKIGGAPANFAYHVSQFGLDGRIVSAVGHDSFGRELLECFREKGFGSHISAVDYPTGTVDVLLDSFGVPTYDIRRNVAWDNMPFTDEVEALAGHTRAVCFGSLAQRNSVSRTAIARFLEAMPDDDGVLKVFDINLRQNFYTPEIIERSMERCNILKINDEELAVVSAMQGHADAVPEDMCRRLLDRYALKALVLTCGSKGSYSFTQDDVRFVSSPAVEVADTVGAGDSFTATFIASLLKGHPVAEAHRLAVAVSAYVCTCHGAMPVLPAELIGAVG